MATTETLQNNFPFTPTPGQQNFIDKFSEFLEDTSPNKLFLTKGYAGTGKTSLAITLVKTLPDLHYKTQLMAPTGRAAKVMAAYTGHSASTIHKKIYKPEEDGQGRLQFKRQKNQATKTVYLIDEASMLSDDPGYGDQGLLSDLIEYVFEGKNNVLVLIGDTAQLPPVGLSISHGLDINYLQSAFNITAYNIELTEVTRQGLHSGILWNATNLRNLLHDNNLQIKFRTKSYEDIYRMNGDKLEDGLRYAYDKYGQENSIVVCRSNKMAVRYNQFIRQTILNYENEIDAGDYLMIAKNNYFFLEEGDPAEFLANGDFVEVQRIVDWEDQFNRRFATLTLRLIDYPDQPPFDAKIMLDVLHMPSPALPMDDYRQFSQEVAAHYSEASTIAEQQEALRNDEYLNALQVKFAYTLTCHKAQGGQWDAVFVDQGFLPEDQINKEYVRWLYTAITRAKSELFLMNFRNDFFE